MAHRDFAGGMLTEWGSHTADLCQWANGADNTTPTDFELAEGTVVCHYANRVKLVFEDGKWPLHVRFVGTEGMVYVDDDGTMEAEPKSLLQGRQFGKGYPQSNHVRNFLDCIKSRRQPIAPAEGAHRANATCQIANICLQLGRSLKFDPAKEKFIGDEMADRMLDRTVRDPWRSLCGAAQLQCGVVRLAARWPSAKAYAAPLNSNVELRGWRANPAD